MKLLNLLLSLLCIASFCPGADFWDAPVIVLVANEPGNFLPTGRDGKALPTIKELQASVMSGTVSSTDQLQLDPNHWTWPGNPKSALLFMTRKSDGVMVPRSHACLIGLSESQSDLLKFEQRDSRLFDHLADVFLSEKDLSIFDSHAKAAIANDLSKYYLPKLLAVQETDPIRRLILATVALNGGGPRCLPTFGQDMEKMSETLRNYKGRDPSWIEGMVTALILEVKEAVTEESFDVFWKIGSQQDEAFRVLMMRQLVFSITSHRALPVTLLESHRAELIQLVQEESVPLGFMAIQALSILDKRADEPRHVKDFLARRTQIRASLMPTK